MTVILFSYSLGVVRRTREAVLLERLVADGSRSAALHRGEYVWFAPSPIQMGDRAILVHAKQKVPQKGKGLFRVDILWFGVASVCVPETHIWMGIWRAVCGQFQDACVCMGHPASVPRPPPGCTKGPVWPVPYCDWQYCTAPVLWLPHPCLASLAFMLLG